MKKQFRKITLTLLALLPILSISFAAKAALQTGNGNFEVRGGFGGDSDGNGTSASGS